MIARAVAVWLAILALASANGAVRAAWLIPRYGEEPGRAISTLVLSVLVVALTWATIRWIHPVTRGDAIGIGVMWLALTVAFEFLAGHYLFGTPWRELLADYDVARGRIWPVVLVLVTVMPLVAARARRIVG